MFWIVRAYKYSWILLIVPALAALYTYLYQETSFFPKGPEPEDMWLETSVNLIVSAATATLSFILGMTLNDAMRKNSEGISLFNAFTGDVAAFGFHVLALTDDNQKDSDGYRRCRDNIRDLLLTAPGLLKWSFRKQGVKLDLVQVKQLSNGESVKLYDRNQAMYCALKKYMSIGAVEAFMLVLGDEIQALQRNGAADGEVMASLVAKWENIYSSYGNLGNLLGYVPPALFQWWLSVCLYIYLIMMPYTFVTANTGYHSIYLSFIVSYLFLGAYVALQKLGDPFAEGVSDTGEFATVTEAAKTAQAAVEELFSREADGGLDDITCDIPEGAAVVNVSRAEIEMRERDSLLSDNGMLY